MSSLSIFTKTKQGHYGWREDPNSYYSELNIKDDFETMYSMSGDISSLSEYHNSLNKKTLESGLLPPGLRFSIPGFLIFERPPTHKLINYIDYSVDQISSATHEGYQSDDEDDDSYNISQEDLIQNVYEIPVPWQIYLVQYSTNPISKYRTTYVKMFFSNTPLRGPDTQLYMPYVNNFFADGTLCNPMFDEYEEISRYPQSLEGVIASAYDWVWNTGFNADLHECVNQTSSQIYHNTVHNPIMKKLIENSMSNLDSVKTFYKLISQMSLEDVASSTWANPSYCSNFDKDKDFIFNYSPKYKNLYLNSIDDPDDFNSSDFINFVGPVNKIKKTYQSVIYHLFVDSVSYPYYTSCEAYLNQNINQLSSFNAYANALRQKCQQV
jgi:hypothetical protein